METLLSLHKCQWLERRRSRQERKTLCLPRRLHYRVYRSVFPAIAVPSDLEQRPGDGYEILCGKRRGDTRVLNQQGAEGLSSELVWRSRVVYALLEEKQAGRAPAELA